jgi:hypothetical protein
MSSASRNEYSVVGVVERLERDNNCGSLGGAEVNWEGVALPTIYLAERALGSPENLPVFRRLCSALAKQTLIEALVLSGNVLQDQHAEILAACLRNAPQQLKYIDVRHNQITAVGGQALTTAVIHNPYILSLVYNDNDIPLEISSQKNASLQKNKRFFEYLLSNPQLTAPTLLVAALAPFQTGISLTAAELLPFSHPSWRQLQVVDFRGCMYIDHIPSSLGHFSEEAPPEIFFDLASLQALDRFVVERAHPTFIIRYAQILLRGSDVDLSFLPLSDQLAEQLPFDQYCRRAHRVILNGSHLTRLPGPLGYIEPTAIQELTILDSDNLSALDAFILQANPPAKVVAYAAIYLPTTQHLNLAGLHLGGDFPDLLPFNPLFQLISVDLTDNPIPRLPASLANIATASLRSLAIDYSCMREDSLDYLYASKAHLSPQNALQAVHYAEMLRTGTPVQIRELKLMLAGAPAVGKTSLLRALREETFDPTIKATGMSYLFSVTEVFLSFFFGGGTSFFVARLTFASHSC